MSYQVLARKWRPKNFHELVGQDHVQRALVSALDNNRLHHAYLFTGTRGVGKTTIARIIAKCLNCETGITSRPCGECSSCREIDEGRFVDLIEVDAASRTKVEDTRELLDNVQYAPSRGRFKVYLIDEVHMLSTHSFNALLKTLEEPPPHVKFLLATTDPQKLPVTVLSRCLQFNLKNMPPERVVEHLTHVLGAEQIPFDEASLWLLGRAADGSMRDALSLTDQAIAFGQGQINASQVSEMLGLVDQRHVTALIEHLINRDTQALLQGAARLSEQAADFETTLADMALYLHRMAIAQLLPDAVDNGLGDKAQVLAHAAQMTAEDVQLYYQIAIKSQEDLRLAPDPRTGFEMALIRMLAFAPQGVPVSQGSAPVSFSREPDKKKQQLAAEPAQAQVEQPTIQPTAQPTTQPTAQPATPPVTTAPASTQEAPAAVDLIKNARAALARGNQNAAQALSAQQAAVSAPVQAAVQKPVQAAVVQAESARPLGDIPPWEELPDSAYESVLAPTSPPMIEPAVAPSTAPSAVPSAAQAETNIYQKMMPEPMPVPTAPEPALVSAPQNIPTPEAAVIDNEATPANITPMVAPCPTELHNNQHWVMLLDHLPLRGFERTIADNAALQERKDSVLVFGISENVRNFINPARIEEWQRALQQVLHEAFTIEIVTLQPNMDTPSQRKERLIALRKQQADQLFMQDDNIQRLLNEFDAEVNFPSIQPLV
ncbi:DNA polymerase-3 subunit gamma/tau [Oceanospirillum multiglobuliferum]|uniref:DNA polymerase III subunit gamma/tau n=1 Tax=Oceanospirillum multiglobuliferum TaxID=64969 RepID=A0A1T4NEG2_9GAMM|nr:DNA polymerase III subunit gamma/tau [Oceanospirillum multiglobuliferum]OPX55936.1 hypothetical protein BTE48_07005 [Oceanospirillum multiglobuliferum]SJZ77456.1 DNA polymerase-3 subunit gamma/tau [Oceanospirillum multiglobuliferum]